MLDVRRWCSVVMAKWGVCRLGKVVAMATTIVVMYSGVVVVSQELCSRGFVIAYVR